MSHEILTNIGLAEEALRLQQNGMPERAIGYFEELARRVIAQPEPCAEVKRMKKAKCPGIGKAPKRVDVRDFYDSLVCPDCGRLFFRVQAGVAHLPLMWIPRHMRNVEGGE